MAKASQLGQLPSNSQEVVSRSLIRSLSRPHASSTPFTRSSRAGHPELLQCRGQQRRCITIDQLDSGRDNRERVVILGSGWAGYGVARRLNPKKFQAVIVSPRSYFVFTPLLASTSVGTLEFRTALEPVRSQRSKVNYFQGWADSVDFKRKTVSIEEAVDDPMQSLAPTGGRHADETKQQREQERNEDVKKGKLFALTYDKLIVSVGCYSQTFGTPGVKEHALFLKDVGDARKIRNRLLACFEAAALPTTSDDMKKTLLNFAIVGGGPTGIEFSAELHDIITEDLAKLYPELIPFHNITNYDVSEKVLPMFDEKLAKYAMDTFKREGISIKTSHHVQELKLGSPQKSRANAEDDHACFTLKVKEEGEVGVGMVVWSTGLMQNPFVAQAMGDVPELPDSDLKSLEIDQGSRSYPWSIKKDAKTGSVITDDRLRVKVVPKGDQEHPEAVLDDVYALGDCAIIEGTAYPATAQVASQKADWIGKRLNKNDLDKAAFSYKNLGVMAYIGNWNGVFQGGDKGPLGNISGRAAWVIWRGAYLTKSVSLRNKILIPTYWLINWLFGRDINRF
ncbi:nucleotide-binding domain-containing protein [Lophiostoma macrostomum CBS 122681]|uniref:Nucleotide-binding domain-containing protein n=1 Tax=Lophiostoma macrostomum CBS 122681 TaxID=1314788 RepID=A0A6A6SXL7_9PLEO|nr:nucleotide-binding domain-containing protein [Lophiostoma macrostomum CBS 122681]